MANLKKYTVTFEASGGVTIEAASADEAREIFESMDPEYLLEELRQNGIRSVNVSSHEDDAP